MTIHPGTRLSHYSIVSKIGAGCMSEVYLAQDTKLDRKVAIKFLHEEFSKDADKLGRFIREAKAASALNHPNILTVYEIGEIDGKNYIATELIDGKTLREHLSNKESLQLNQILKIGVQVSEALSAAHQAGIIHRDIKPENIMLRKDGYAKVLDFGLAKLSEPVAPGSAGSEDATRVQVNTTPGMVMGTVSYMSPEQARGTTTDARTDIWSLGVVLYEMLSGRVPFTGETINHTIVSILEKEPQLLTNVPAELQRIVRKSMTKDVDMRYQSAHDLLIDLKNLRRDLDIQGELERSIIPNRAATTESAIENQTQVYASGSVAATSSGQAVATHSLTTSSSSLEYAVTQARSHQLVTAIIGVLLVGVISTVGYFAFVSRGGSTKQISSIAVMPFVNESGNADVEYLSDGMTETLIKSLSQLPNLAVKSRSTVFYYKGKETSPKKIGEELNVQAVLLGRVVQRGDDLKLNLELVNTKTQDVIWSEQYDRKQSDLVSLQSEIARDVSGKLKAKLSGADEQKLAKTYTTNPEAYRLYLQGRFYWNKREEKEFRKAVEYYNQAIALDTNYALAYVGLADSYALLSSFGFMPPTEAIPKARDFARRALSLDDSLAEPHATLGYVSSQYNYDFAGAELELKRAIELNPNYAMAHQWYGEMLSYVGRYDEAAAEYRRALEIEPLSLPINWEYGRLLYNARRFDEALAQLKKTVELDPGFARAHRTLSEVYWFRGDYANAVEERAKFFDLIGQPQNGTLIRATFAKEGWPGFLRLLVAENSPLRDSNNNWTFAKAYVGLGEKDKAFAELNKAYENRISSVVWFKVEPQLDPLRSDPRFQELLKKVGFSP